jgi:hypothetical protein
MTKREYKIREFLNHLQEEERKNKNLSYQFYKSLGIVKEDELKTKDSYEKLVKEEIKKFKIKYTPKEEAKMEEKIDKEKSDRQDDSIRRLLYGVFALYVVIVGYVIYKRKQTKELEQKFKKEMEEKMKERRMSKFVYVGENN